MKAIGCLILVGLGVIIAAPITVIILAIEIAQGNVDSIRKYMSGADTKEEMKNMSKEELREYVKNKKR